MLRNSEKEIDVLDTAKILRQMLMDGQSLMDIVNTDQIDIRFTVGKNSEELMKLPGTIMMYSELSGAMNIPEYRLSLKKQRFLNHIIFYSDKGKVMVKDIIMNSAIAGGGVHFATKPKPEHARTQSLLAGINGWGLPMETHYLREISNVTVTALQPLIEVVEKRVMSAPGWQS